MNAIISYFGAVLFRLGWVTKRAITEGGQKSKGGQKSVFKVSKINRNLSLYGNVKDPQLH